MTMTTPIVVHRASSRMLDDFIQSFVKIDKARMGELIDSANKNGCRHLRFVRRGKAGRRQIIILRSTASDFFNFLTALETDEQLLFIFGLFEVYKDDLKRGAVEVPLFGRYALMTRMPNGPKGETCLMFSK